MVNIKDARAAYRALDGVICVYKPPGTPVRQVIHTIVTNLCRDLNALPIRGQEKRVEIVGATNSPMKVKVLPNYADDPLVIGPRYQHEDFKCSYSTHLGLFSSGVLVLGINAGNRLKQQLHLGRPTRAYKVHGRLGKATDTYFWNGKSVERATFAHVTRERMDTVIAHMQAAHQQTMYKLSGLDIQSESLYELASKGMIRPADGKAPVLYGIKCVHFKPPDFTLEIQSVNEYDLYLWTLIHDLGVQLKTAAHCTGVQCIRQGKFDVHLALLRKHWQLHNILYNIDKCNEILKESEDLLQQKSAYLH